jgi:hypothetical protein
LVCPFTPDELPPRMDWIKAALRFSFVPPVGTFFRIVSLEVTAGE